MSVTILDTLTPEDLSAWRETSARWDGMRFAGNGQNVSYDERRKVCLDYYEHAADLLQRYEVRGEEAVEARISPYTGAIFIGEGE